MKPYSIQIELTEGCNRLCEFCGLSGLRQRPLDDLHFMTPELAFHLAQEISHFAPRARLELAMHGEPLLNPEHLTIIGILRKALPATQLMLTTNGLLLLKDMCTKITALFDAGLDMLVVDTYLPEREKLRSALLQSWDNCYDFYQGGGPSPWYNYHRKQQRLVIMLDDPRVQPKKAQRILVNHTGLASTGQKVNRPLSKTCTLPFRELPITYNGEVCLCCNDFGKQLVVGDIRQMALADIWNGKILQAARRILGSRQRTFIPCAVCDHGAGMRSGLLPKTPPPTEQDFEIVRQAARPLNADV